MDCGGASISLFLDRLHTVEIGSQPVTRLDLEEVSGGRLRINDVSMSTAAPDYRPFPMGMKVDPEGQFVVESCRPRDRVGTNGAVVPGRTEGVVKPETSNIITTVGRAGS